MKKFRILSIGNSFSEDAHRYLFDIFKAKGYESKNILVANLYIPGANLLTHVNNIKNKTKAYQYQYYGESTRKNIDNYSIDEAILNQEWDFITLQQSSPDSGIFESYSNYLETLISFIKENTLNKDVKIGFHMTWAYQINSTHPGFIKYNQDQLSMYDSIKKVMINKVINIKEIDFIIPSGTAIQNARTSYIGDTLTKDGYHLNDLIGRFIAGLIFYKVLTNDDLDIDWLKNIKINLLATEFLISIESVNNAYENNFIISKSKYN